MKNSKTHRGRNEGSFKKMRNGKWRVWASLPLGRRVSKTFSTKGSANSWVHQLLGAPNNILNEKSSQTVEAYLADWLVKRKSDCDLLKESTSIDYEANIKNYVLPYLGDIKLCNIKKPLIQELYNQLLTKGVGRYSISYAHRILRKAFNDAVSDEIITTNPFTNAKPPRINLQTRKNSPLNQGQAIELTTTAMKHPIGPLIHTALASGMRQGELLSLMWSDVDWDRQLISVERTLTKTIKDGHLTRKFGPPKTSAGSRWVELDNKTLEILHFQNKQVEKMKLYAGERWIENDLVFPSIIGTPLNPSNVRKIFLSLLKEAQLPQIRFHDLRHTHASIAIENGDPLSVLSSRLGHTKISTTSDIYTHKLNAVDRKIAGVMEKVFESVPVPESDLLQATKMDSPCSQ